MNNQNNNINYNQQNNINYQTNNQIYLTNKLSTNKFIYLLIGGIVTISIITTTIVITFKSLNHNQTNNTILNNNVENKKDSSTQDTSKLLTKYEEYTDDYPIEKRNIDYYWNINTTKFDKSKFDGKILLFDNLIEGEITGKSLIENGYTFHHMSSYSCGNPLALWGEDINYTSDCPFLLKNNKIYPIDYITVGAPDLINYDKNNDFTSENTELYYEYGKTNKFIDFVTETVESNIIYPYLDGTKYDDLTIDKIIEKLGVPKYVGERESNISDSILIFSYYYEYDKYVFKFSFIYTDKISLSSVTYMGIKTFNNYGLVYDRKTDSYATYTLKESLQNSYAKYLKNFK